MEIDILFARVLLIISIIVFISGCVRTISSGNDEKIVQVPFKGDTFKGMVVLNTEANGPNQYCSYTIDPRVISLQVESSTQSSTQILKDIPFYNQKKIDPSKSLMQLSMQPSGISEDNTSYTFYVIKTINGQMQSIQATLRYSNTKCLIYTENTGVDLSHINWESIGNFFNTVYTTLSPIAQPSDIDNNGKVVLLFNTMPTTSGGIIAGYFLNSDLYDTLYSNRMEIVYLNIKLIEKSNYNELNVNDTIAHESFHLFNYGSRVLKRNQEELSTWIEEGIAESMSHYVLNQVLTDRINELKNDIQIRNGLSLTQWVSQSINYALSYTFFQYCRIHSKSGWGIFKKIIEKNENDVSNIESVMKEENTEFGNFKTLLFSYKIANLLYEPTGLYGYQSETTEFTALPLEPNQKISSLPATGSLYFYTDLKDFKLYGGPNVEVYKIYR